MDMLQFQIACGISRDRRTVQKHVAALGGERCGACVQVGGYVSKFFRKLCCLGGKKQHSDSESGNAVETAEKEQVSAAHFVLVRNSVTVSCAES